MKVLFLMIAYPNVSRDSNMYTDLTQEFLLKGHDVYVAAPDISPTKLSVEGGVKVLRIKTLPLFNTSVFQKGIANVLLPYQYRSAIIRFLPQIQFDVVITPTPPITFVGLAKFFKKKYGSKVYLILRDIFPQNAKDLGLINNMLIFNFFRRKEKELYLIADSIGCMSRKNIEYVLSHNPEVNPDKLHLLPNWMRVKELDNNSNKQKSVLDLNGKFVAIFGGNFGTPQKIEFIVEVAEKLKGRKEFLFLLVGDGTEKNRIKKLVEGKQLPNIVILDLLSRDEYLGLLKECNVGLVNLSDKFTIPNIPSRTLAYWALKLPVLAAVDKNTDYGELLGASNGGLWSVMGETDAYIANLVSLYNNPEKRKQMGENGYNYLVRELNSQNAYKTIISKF